MFSRETTIDGSFVSWVLYFVGPITNLAHLLPESCDQRIGWQYVTRSVIGWKLFTLQDVEAGPSVCTEPWLPTQWVNRPKLCPTPLSYWILPEPRVWLSSQSWHWHGWRDFHQDFLLSSVSRASSMSSTHGKLIGQLPCLFTIYSQIL